MARCMHVCSINPKTGDVSELIETACRATCLKFDPLGHALGIGHDDGIFSIYDTDCSTPTTSYSLFESSALCCDWRDNIVIAGSRTGDLSVADVREKEATTYERIHSEEVCSVRFGTDANRIATSSNDSEVKIWDLRNLDAAFLTYGEHQAAVRAMDWSPLSRDVIVTGGGTTDRTVRIWDVNTGKTLSWISTGSQVCNLFWSAEHNEILSTHGFSQYQLALWRGADLTPITELFEHKQRVLFMATSPDRTRVVTAAPDDDMRIWVMFPSSRRSLVRSMLMIR